MAFFAQLQRSFYLPLLVGLHGITDTTSQKPANEEKMFWKITLPSAIIFMQKMVGRLINFIGCFYRPNQVLSLIQLNG